MASGQIARELDALASVFEGGLDVADEQGHHRPAEEIPGQRLGVVGEARRLDRGVQLHDGLVELASDEPGKPEDGVGVPEELTLSGRASDGQHTLRMCLGLREVVEEELRAGEIRCCVETEREFLIGEGVHERGGLETLGLRGRARHAQAAREREGGDGCRGERRILEPPRGLNRLGRPSPCRLVVDAVEGVDDELDHEGDGLRRAPVPKAVEGTGEAVMRGVVLAEQALDPGAACGEPCSEIDRLVRHDRQALLQRAMAVLIAADRSQRFGAGEEEFDALFARRALGEQAKCRLVPARRARRCAVCGCVAGRPECRDGGRVALCGRALDVVGARGCRRAAGRQQLGAAFVRAEAPAARCRLVDRSAHERVTEPKASRDVGRANEVAPQQLVECL